MEHIVPVSQGGTNQANNLALACFGCNLYKQDKTSAIDPLTGNEVRLFHPRIDNWSTHFTWNSEITQLIGKTTIGRATVVLLKLNRIQLINLRTLLSLFGEIPPKHLL